MAVELKGSCSSVHVTSRKISTSPLTSAPLQDSLEIILEQEQSLLEAPIASEEQVSLDNVPNNFKYEFHDNHGRNIEITGDRTTSRRLASYNQGVVVVQPSLVPNYPVQIVVKQLDMRWQSSLMVGIVCGSPERLNLPGTALAFKGASCIIANDWISVNGAKVGYCF